MSRALIFSIEEFSVFDGPGMRSTIFLMGCPLRCEWCHSPEGQGFDNFILRSQNGCIGCGKCLKYAVQSDNNIVFTKQSVDNCPNTLLRYCATEYTPEQLYRKLEKNFSILSASGGGVTFSGGEPTSHPEFLIDCLKLLSGKVHRAIQTSGACQPAVFKRILQYCDFVLFDVKLVNESLHIRYTGASNRNILENFKLLVNSHTDFVIRTPLIPQVTDTNENLISIAKLLAQHNIRSIELLPYNKLAGAKYTLVGKEYCPTFDTSLPVSYGSDLFVQYGIQTKIL